MITITTFHDGSNAILNFIDNCISISDKIASKLLELEINNQPIFITSFEGCREDYYEKHESISYDDAIAELQTIIPMARKAKICIE